MAIDRPLHWLVAGLLAFGAGGAAAQEPLSIIDWLDTVPTPAAPRVIAPPAPVIVTPLAASEPTRIGLAPPQISGLAHDIWQSLDGAALAQTLAGLPDQGLPAGQALLMTLLLAETTNPPATPQAQDQFLLARVDMLIHYGAMEPALALLQSAGATATPDRFARFMDVALLLGLEDAACAQLLAQAHLAPSQAHLVFCLARAGDWRGADVVLGAHMALAQEDAPLDQLLLRFLHPDAFEDSPLPDVPLSPLMFRLRESIGEPLPTRPLPRAYAVADLRDIAGWKAQLDAAERLARSGALADNRLLGLYSERIAAASGGVWDRVRAVQQLESALQIGEAARIERALITAWDVMFEAGLAPQLAVLFADQLAAVPLRGPARQIALRLQLLSPGYRAAAQSAGTEIPAVLRALALGQSATPHTPLDDALLEGAILEEAAPNTAHPADPQALGAALLTALALLQRGADGDLGALTSSLNILNMNGFTDAARRASLQMLLLADGGI